MGLSMSYPWVAYLAIRLSKAAKEVQISVIPNIALWKFYFFPNINVANFTVGYRILCITRIEFGCMQHVWVKYTWVYFSLMKWKELKGISKMTQRGQASLSYPAILRMCLLSKVPPRAPVEEGQNVTCQLKLL